MRRLATGGRIDRARSIEFDWNGRPLSGFAGDTLASALLGAGVDILGTSVSFARPRGITSAGLEEATAFVQLTRDTATEPLVRATGVALSALGPRLSATGSITKGRIELGDDGARFDKRFAYCDLLVVGAGPAGIAATLEGSRAGARVMLVDTDFEIGGALLRDGERIDGVPASEWVARARAELEAASETCVLTNTVAAIHMDQNGMLLAQRIDPSRSTPGAESREPRAESRLWHVRAKAIVHATGALERPLVFPDNDRPGVMLASAARAYLRRFALAPARGIVFTTNDDAYRTALAWHEAGVAVAGIIDVRAPGSSPLRTRARELGIAIHDDSVVEGTIADGDGRLDGVRVRTPSGPIVIEGDLLAVSAGWEANIGLHVQRRGATRFDERLACAVPAAPLPGQWIAGAARGTMSLDVCIAEGARAAREALGVDRSGLETRDSALGTTEDAPSPIWHVPAADGDESRSFVDLHRDVTVAGIERAVASGITHIEHVKRFTLAGTGVEQGRTARTNSGLLTASLTGRPAADVGTSGGRPPSEPLLFSLMAGRASGERYEPVRRTSMHAGHVALGAVFENAGSWQRPSRYPRAGETLRETVARECLAARRAVGIVDVSTLGKIDVRGPDASWFLDQLYANAIESIPVGRARYSVMCGMDGSILDDGIVMRTGPQRFFITASTGHAATVVDWMEEWLQTEWPSKRVWVTSLTEQLATIAVVGPSARALIGLIAPTLDASNEAFPFLSVRRAAAAGIDDAQIARVSFSGELAFEVSVPWEQGPALWRALLDHGASLGVTPYGLDVLQVLRIEKGYIIVGQDTEALTTPDDAGLSWLVSKKKEFVGRRSHARPAARRTDRAQLVGFTVLDSDEPVPEGAALTATVGAPPMRIDGHVTSSVHSASLGVPLGLALVHGGRARLGEVLHAPLLDGRVARVRLTSPVHWDAEGARRDG